MNCVAFKLSGFFSGESSSGAARFLGLVNGEESISSIGSFQFNQYKKSQKNIDNIHK